VLDSRGRVVGVTFAMLSLSPTALRSTSRRSPSKVRYEPGSPGHREYFAEAAKQLSELKKREVEAAKLKQDFATQELQSAASRQQQGLTSEQEVRQAKIKAVDAETATVKALAALKNAEAQISAIGKASPYAERLLDAAKLTTRTSGSSGFAIPINRVKSILDDLKAGREIERGWLGAMLNTKKDGKIEFSQVEKDSPPKRPGSRPMTCSSRRTAGGSMTSNRSPPMFPPQAGRYHEAGGEPRGRGARDHGEARQKAEARGDEADSTQDFAECDEGP